MTCLPLLLGGMLAIQTTNSWARRDRNHSRIHSSWLLPSQSSAPATASPLLRTPGSRPMLGNCGRDPSSPPACLPAAHHAHNGRQAPEPYLNNNLGNLGIALSPDYFLLFGVLYLCGYSQQHFRGSWSIKPFQSGMTPTGSHLLWKQKQNLFSKATYP